MGEQIARNNARTAAGTAEERRKTAETNRGLRAQQQLLRTQQNRQAIALAGLRQESGLLANVRRQTELLDRETRNAGGGARLFSRAFGELAGTLGAIGITEVAFGLVSFGRNVVDASVRVEGFRNSLTALYGDAQIADRVLGDLQEAARLPGITFEGAVQGAIRLKTVQIEGDRAQRIITEFGNAAALSGASAEEMNRALVGLTQTVARGQIEQDNLNQILENVPLIGNAIREAFNSIDAETIRDTLDAAGQDVNDFVDILTNQLSMGARASADTTANAFSNLRNSTFELSAAIGDSLTPSVRDAAMFLTGLLDGITDFIEGNQFGRVSAEEFAEAISGTTQSVRELLPELDEYIRNLEQQQRSRGGISSEQLASLNEARDLYNLVNGAIAGNADAIQQLETRTQSAKDALDAANTEQERLKAAIDAVDPSIRSERDSLQGLNADLRANTERVEEAQSEYNDLNRVLTSVTQEADSLKQGISELEAPTTMTRGAIGELDATIASTDARFLSFNERADTLSGSIRALPPEITAVRTEFDVLAPTAERVNAIFTTYNETLGEYVRVSGIVVTSAQREQEALDAVTQGIVQQTQDAEGLAHVQEVLTQRTDAHNAALVNPAVSDAVDSLRNYANIIGDVNIGYDEITPATQDFVDGLVDQESAFDDLREATDAADLSLGVLDGNFNKVIETISNVPNATDDATESFRDFSLGAIEYIDDITRAFSPLFDTVGDVGAELENFTTLITSLATGNVLGIISSTANIVLPGLTDPLRVLDFTQPAVEGDPRQLDTSALGLTPVELEQLDFSGVAPGLRALLGLEGGGEGGFNVFQARSRTEAAQRAAEATGTDRQAIEDVAAAQYGGEAYAAEVAAAQEVEQEAAEESVNTEEERADSITRIRERLAERLLDIEVDLARDLRDITTDLNRDIIEIENQKARDLIAIDTDLAREQRDIRTELSRDLIAIDTDLNRDLRDIDTDLARERRDIGIELRRDIRDSHTELARDIRDINRDLGRDLIAIDTDLARERRDIGIELTRDLAEIETGLTREIQEINTDLSRDLVDIDTDLARERRDIRVELSRDLRDIETGLTRDFRDIHRDLNRDLRDIDTDLARERRDIETDLAREIVDIDTELSRDQRDIALDLSRDLEDIETDRLNRVEELNREHQEQLTDIQQDGMRRREDLELDATRSFEDLRQDFRDAQEAVAVRFDRGEISEEEARREVDELAREFTRDSARLQRRNQRRLEDQSIRQARAVQDAQTEQVQDTADIERRTGTRVGEAELSAARADADAQQDLADSIADALSGAVQDTADALQSVGDDQADARQGARDDRVDARIDARDDRIDARQDARDSTTDARQDARDDRIDARQDARDDRADARREAQYDREDALLNAVYATADARQEARDDRADARLDAQYDREDARIDARDDRVDARLDARDSLADARQGARDDQQDVRQSARDDMADTRLQAQYDLSDALLGAQDDRADVRLEAREDIADARQGAREDRIDARQDARDAITDALFSDVEELVTGGGLAEAVTALQTVAENFHVLVTGNSADVRRLPAGSAPPVLPPTVTQPAPATPQGNQMAVINMEFPDGTIKELRGQIVQQQQDGRSL